MDGGRELPARLSEGPGVTPSPLASPALAFFLSPLFPSYRRPRPGDLLRTYLGPPTTASTRRHAVIYAPPDQSAHPPTQSGTSLKARG